MVVWEKNWRLLSWHEFLTSFVLWAPLAIIYFSRVSGSYTLGLSVFSVAMVAAAVFELPTGVFSDRVGRKKTLIFGSVSYIVSFVFYALGLNYYFLLAGAVFEGLARAFYSGNNEALLYDSLAQDHKEELFGYLTGRIGSMGQWALAIAGVLGGLLAVISFPLLMWLSVIPFIICLFISLQISDVKKYSSEEENIFSHLKEALINFKTNYRLKLLSISSIIGFGMGEASFQFRSAFVEKLWPIWAIGWAQVLSNIGAAVSFRLSGRIMRRFKPILILLTGNVYSKAAYLVALLFPSILSPAIMSTTSLFYGVGEVSKRTLMQQEFSQKQRATMGSLNSFAGSLFFSVFAVILGLVADRVGPTNALIFVIVLQFSQFWLQWRIFKTEK